MSKRRLLRSLFPPLFALALCACAGTEKTPASDGAPVPAETGEPADPAAPFVAELEKALADGDADLAAYFAEYVLSANELKAFVEKNFPASATTPSIPPRKAREKSATRSRGACSAKAAGRKRAVFSLKS